VIFISHRGLAWDTYLQSDHQEHTRVLSLWLCPFPKEKEIEKNKEKNENYLKFFMYNDFWQGRSCK
jgi:hypothetical protein